MEFKNDLDVVAGVASRAVLHAKYHDSDGKVKDIMGTGAGNGLDLDDFRREFIPLSTDNHPSTGVDYYAGSLADGEITGRYLLYQRDESIVDNPTTAKTVKLLRDVGAKFNMAGDGATFLLHVQKTVMTAGAKGDVSDIELNYDTNNTAKEGYFTTTSVYPVYIKAADLATTNELDIPIDGIGENLQGGKNFLAPHLKVKFNGDGTITFVSVTGYDNDGNSTGATGANYDIIVDVIATFSTQNGVSQLPETVNLFSGSASDEIALSGSSNFYENVMDGLEITLDGFLYTSTTVATSTVARIPISNIGINKVLRISKEYLIDGYTNHFKVKDSPNYDGIQGAAPGSSTWTDRNFIILESLSYAGKTLKISSQGLDLKLSLSALTSDHRNRANFAAKVLKVTPYKN